MCKKNFDWSGPVVTKQRRDSTSIENIPLSWLLLYNYNMVVISPKFKYGRKVICFQNRIQKCGPSVFPSALKPLTGEQTNADFDIGTKTPKLARC